MFNCVLWEYFNIMNNLRALMRPNIRDLKPYSTARDEYQGDVGTYLDANENPFDSGYNRYPDPYQKELKEALSAIKSVEARRIFAGNGSDEAIDLVFRVFCVPGVDNVVSMSPTYGMYKVAAEINDVRMREVPLLPGFRLDAGAMLAACDANTKAIFLCSPNNPTGNALEREAIERILREFQGITVIDEAYADFYDGDSFLARLGEYPNLIVLQTLSKAWGMAGLRLGLAFADPVIIDTFTRVKYPYNINVATQRIVLEKLREGVARQVQDIISQRDALLVSLDELEVVKEVYPSDSNFLLVRFDDPRAVYDMLIDRGIIVRDRSQVPLCEGCLRITVGTEQENRKLLDILNSIK